MLSSRDLALLKDQGAAANQAWVLCSLRRQVQAAVATQQEWKGGGHMQLRDQQRRGLHGMPDGTLQQAVFVGGDTIPSRS